MQQQEYAHIDAELLKLIQALIGEIHPQSEGRVSLTLDSVLDKDLGIDSLARTELILRIERRFHVALPEYVYSSANTPRDLLRAILSASKFSATLIREKVGELELGEAAVLPYRAETLIEMLDWHVREHPERPHIRFYSDTDEGELITYRQLQQGAASVAAGLQALDLERGQAVTIMLPTGADYFLSFYGILMAGGVPVPIYPPVRPAQLEDHLRRQTAILRNAMATVLIAEAETKRLARLLRSHVESLRSVTTVAELSTRSGSHDAPAIGASDTAFLQYTSGSTGNPKGVILTHANLLANVRNNGAALEADPRDVFVSWLPLYHDMGLIGAWLGSLYFSVLLVVMSPLAFLSRPQRWLWAIHRHGGTLSAAPNFAYELCLRRLEDRDLEGLDLGSWRVAVNGAEGVSAETVRDFCARFKRYGFRPERMLPVYGLAECSAGLCFSVLNRRPVIDRVDRERLMRDGEAVSAGDGDAKALCFVSCGSPLPGHEVRIVDRAGREMPERQEGRVQFRGPSATSGYFRNPKATQQLFDDGWLNAGDLGYIAAGELYITGRSKDIIIRAGRNIYPEELEEAVGQIDGIRKGRVVVFGGADARTRTERLIILAETREREPEVRKDLRDRIQTIATDLVGLPADDVVLAPVNTVLKTSSGKLRRAACRERYERGRIGQRQRAVWWQLTRVALAGMMPQLRRFQRSLGEGAYAGYVWVLLAFFTALTWPLVVLLPCRRWRWGVTRGAARLLILASGTPFGVRGLPVLPPPHRPCIFVSNHMSYLDSLFLVAGLPRRFGFLAKVELLAWPFLRIFLQRIDVEFVERYDTERALIDARRVSRAALAGRSLLFYAEGTFTRMPGLLSFHMGGFTTAVEGRVPLVPVAIRGTRSMLRAGSWFPHRGTVAITIGEPLYPEEEDSGDPWAAAIRLRAAARRHILRHCGEPDLGH